MRRCYLCEKEGADTTEHVVPRCLYPGKLPSDVVTLPAHRTCNQLTSKDEEAFRNHVAGAINPSHGAHVLWDKTWKAVHRPNARGMLTQFYGDMRVEPVLDDEGRVIDERLAARLDRERAEHVLAKIVKGLFFWKTGDVLKADGTLWTFGQADRGRERLRLPHSFNVHDVLDVRWGRAQDDPLGTMWVLGFHGVAWFWIATSSTSNTIDGARPMSWDAPAEA